MKFPRGIALAFAVLFMVVPALTPAQSSQKNTDEKKEPLFFVKIAADVATNIGQQSLNNFLAIYIASRNWEAAGKDGDLGPFMTVKEAKGKEGHSAACLFSSNKDAGLCVYFDGETPFGVAAVKAGANGKIDPGTVAAAYKPVSREMLKKSDQKLNFSSGDASTDAGQPLPAFLITTE